GRRRLGPRSVEPHHGPADDQHHQGGGGRDAGDRQEPVPAAHFVVGVRGVVPVLRGLGPALLLLTVRVHPVPPDSRRPDFTGREPASCTSPITRRSAPAASPPASPPSPPSARRRQGRGGCW